MNKIFIVVRGGVVQYVSAVDPALLEVRVLDMDDFEDPDFEDKAEFAEALAEADALIRVW